MPAVLRTTHNAVVKSQLAFAQRRRCATRICANANHKSINLSSKGDTVMKPIARFLHALLIALACLSMQQAYGQTDSCGFNGQ